MGFGTMDAEDGSSFEGNFINYRFHGKGKMRWGNGSVFEGFIVSDTPYSGKFTNYDGSVIYISKGVAMPKDSIKEKRTGYSPKIGIRQREYFDEDWNRCQPKDAAFYRIVTYEAPNKPKGVVKDYYISGKLQGEATFVYIDYDASFGVNAGVSVSLSANLFTSIKSAQLAFEQSKISFDEAIRQHNRVIRDIKRGATIFGTSEAHRV